MYVNNNNSGLPLPRVESRCDGKLKAVISNHSLSYNVYYLDKFQSP